MQIQRRLSTFIVNHNSFSEASVRYGRCLSAWGRSGIKWELDRIPLIRYNCHTILGIEKEHISPILAEAAAKGLDRLRGRGRGVIG